MIHFNLILTLIFQPTGRCYFMIELHVFLQSVFCRKPSEVLQNFWCMLCHESVPKQGRLRRLSHGIVGDPLWIWFKGVGINVGWSDFTRPFNELSALNREANPHSHIAGTSRILVFASVRTLPDIQRRMLSLNGLTLKPCPPNFRVLLVTDKLVVAELPLHFVRRTESSCPCPNMNNLNRHWLGMPILWNLWLRLVGFETVDHRDLLT